MPQMRLVVDPRERVLHTMLLGLQEKFTMTTHVALAQTGGMR
jgi:hypothetical protein